MHKYTIWKKGENENIVRIVDIIQDTKKSMFTIKGTLTTGLEKKDPIDDGEFYFNLYEKYKNAVLVQQEYTQSLRYEHKKKEEWKAVFIEFLEISIVNAWIIQKDYLPYVTLKRFKISLIHSWLEEYR